MTDFKSAIVYFRDQFVPYSQATIPIGNVSFLYGLGIFTGMRVHANPETHSVYVFRPTDHYTRLINSAKLCHLANFAATYSQKDFIDLISKLISKNKITTDVYIRVTIFPDDEGIGAKYGYKDSLSMFLYPLGDYVPTTGMRCSTSSYQRINDNAIPARAKVIGAYVNTALAKTDAIQGGFDETILLDDRGHAVEGSAENLFIVRNDTLITPPVTDNILEGITRQTVLSLASDLGITTLERSIDRTELYIADEVLLTGTGAKISPVIEIDHRPIGTGKIGPISLQLQQLYDDTVRGKNNRRKEWVVQV